jgi:hypothetical protein
VFLIKRVKAAAGGPAKTHFAAAVAAAGNVTAWVGKPDAATPVDAATADRVAAYYAAKAEAGQPVGEVTAVRAPDAEPKPEPKPAPKPPPPPPGGDKKDGK